METNFQVESAHLEVSAGEKLLHESWDVHSFLRKEGALYSRRVAKVFDIDSCNSKSPSAGARKFKNLRRIVLFGGFKETA